MKMMYSKKIPLLFLVAALLVGGKARAISLDGGEYLDQNMSPPVADLYNATQIDADNTNLVVHSETMYVDLARELELSERERNSKGISDDKESVIKSLETELDQRITELKVLQEKLSGDIKTKTEKNENLKLLVSMYEALSPSQAADLIKQLPYSVSLTMMEMMNQKKSSKILAAMDSKFAAEFSRRLLRAPALSKMEAQAK